MMRIAGLCCLVAIFCPARDIPDVPVVTHEGRRARFYTDLVKDRTVVVSFLFTTCKGVCPRTAGTLLAVRKLLSERVGRDMFVYSVTLDPDTDTPEVLARYSDEVGGGNGWTFLTGRPADLEKLRKNLGFSDPDPDPVIDADRTQHGAVIVFGNDAMDRWSALPAFAGAERIAEAIRRVADGVAARR
jgi:protein SCO1/2